MDNLPRRWGDIASFGGMKAFLIKAMALAALGCFVIALILRAPGSSGAGRFTCLGLLLLAAAMWLLFRKEQGDEE